MRAKHKATKIMLTLAVAAAFVFLLVATSSPPEKTNQYQVGDAIQWYTLEVTVFNLDRVNEYAGLMLLPDHEFIVVRVQFKNNGAYDCDYPDDPDQFFLAQDSETYIPSRMAIEKENPYTYRFSGNESAKGTYIYMVPKGKAGFVLWFDYHDHDGTVRSKVSLDD